MDVGNMMVVDMTASKVAFILLIRFHLGNTEITTKPKDTETVIGDLVYFNCSSSVAGGIQWFFNREERDQDRSIIYGYDQLYDPFKGRMRVETIEATTTYNLIIDSAIATDAGKYECQEDVGRGAKSSAQLIVLGSDPVCQSNIDTSKVIGSNDCGIEPSLLILSCIVNYHGKEAPIMQWKKDGNANVTGTMNREIMGNQAIYNLSMKAEPNMHNSFYTCNTTRSVTTKNGCKSGTIKIIGTTSESLCASCRKSDCKGYSDAIICIFVIILPLAICGAIASTWYYLYKRFKRAPLEKDKIEPIFYCGIFGRFVQRFHHKSKDEVKRPAEPGSEELMQLNRSEIQSEPETTPFQSKIQQNKKEDIDKINDIEDKVVENDTKIRELQGTVNDQSQIINIKETEIEFLKRENDQLRQSVQNLERHLYPSDSIDYSDKPKLVQTIVTKLTVKEVNKQKASGPAVTGMAILGNELFVVYDESSEIEVYDSETFKILHNLSVKNIHNPLDIASSKVNQCLYIINGTTKDGKSQIFRMKPNGDVRKFWQTKGGYGRLSNYEKNVIVCLLEEQIIYEYTEDGETVTEVRLSPGDGFNHPWHAIKVTNIHFVVSHGNEKDNFQRVCVVDKDGRIIKVCQTREKSGIRLLSHDELSVPTCLLQDRDRRILVADTNHKRILLLSAVMKYEKKLIEEEKNGLKDSPTRLCFDEKETRLFVAVNRRGSGSGKWNDGRVLIFNMRK